MNRNRLAREAAWQLAVSACKVFSPLLRDEEILEAHRELFDLFQPELEQLLLRYDRDRKRARIATPDVPNSDPPTATSSPEREIRSSGEPVSNPNREDDQ